MRQGPGPGTAVLTVFVRAPTLEEAEVRVRAVCRTLARPPWTVAAVWPGLVDEYYEKQKRTVAALPLRMIITDRESTLVPANPVRSEEGAVLLHGPGTVAALCALFENLWVTGTPLIESVPCAGDELGRQEREVLRLLAQGLTDEAVALRLGVSLRTTRRITAKLMERLGARSRIQAGLRAAELGWL